MPASPVSLLTGSDSRDNLHLRQSRLAAPVGIRQDGTSNISAEGQYEVRRVERVVAVVRRCHGYRLDLLPGALANLPFEIFRCQTRGEVIRWLL